MTYDKHNPEHRASRRGIKEWKAEQRECRAEVSFATMSNHLSLSDVL